MNNLSLITEGTMYELPLATGYADAADNLVETIDLSVQKDSYEQFIKEIIPYYLYGKGYSSKYNATKTSETTGSLNVVVEFDNWYIKPSAHTADWCKKRHTSLEAELIANIRVQVRGLTERGETIAAHERYMEILVTKFPMLTKSGSLIINGVEKILTSHLEPACKVRLEVLDKKGSRGEKVLKFITSSRVFSTMKPGVVNAMNSQIVIKQQKINNNMCHVISIGQFINNYQVVDLLRAICPDAMKESYMREILGINQQLLSSVEYAAQNNTKQRSELDVMSEFELRYVERQNLNKRLSYTRRAAGRVLAQDIPELGLKAGHVLTKDDVQEAQFLGLPLYIYPKTGIGLRLRVFSNNFVNADTLFNYYKENGKSIVKPEVFNGKMVHLPTFKNLIEKSETENIDMSTLLKLNYADLIGRNLLVDDIVALVNLYGAFLSNDEDEDDIDSLAIKSITNISEIYEEIFSSRFRLGGEGYIPEKFVTALNRAKNKGNSDSESFYSNSSIDINCEEKITITSKLGTCSLLDQADTAGPLSEVNHRRKVSLKKVEGRGGTDSQTSIRKPRSVNPSMVTRLDVVESPEGANIGLIRYLTATAIVNGSGDIESPWLVVNNKMRRIVYDKVYYLNYDREMELVRAVGAEIGRRDAVKIRVFGLNPKYRDSTFGKNEIAIENLPWDDDTKWMVIEEQEYPVEYVERESTDERIHTSDYITTRYDYKYEELSSITKNVYSDYEVRGGLWSYEQIAKGLMGQAGGYKFELDFERANWFNKQRVLTYKYNPSTGQYAATERREQVNCYSGHGEIISVNAEDVDIVSLSDEHIFSPVGSSIPFSAYDDLTRKMMGNAHNKSAEPLLHGEAPTITTQIARKSAEMATGVVKSPVQGVVTFVDSSKIIVKDDATGASVTVPLVTGFKSVIKTMIISVPAVKPGDRVKSGELIADSNMTKSGNVAHGIELLGAYLPFEGFNYEDGIILSDRIVKESLLTSPHFKTCTQRLSGKRARSGGRSTDIFSPTQTYKATPGIMANFQKGHDGRSPKIVIDRDKFDDNYLIKPGIVVSTGDVLAYYISEVMSSDSDSHSGEGGRTNIKTKVNTLIYKDTETGFIISSDIITIKKEEHIQIIVGHEEHIKKGDKISGIHGNKGVISNILPERDMPRLADGRILDIVLSPLGVPSRMNIGQLFEGQVNPVLKKYGLTAVTSATQRFPAKDFVKLMCEFNQDSDGDISLYDEQGGRVGVYKTEYGKISKYAERLEAGIYYLCPYKTETDVYSIKVDGHEVLDFNELRNIGVDYKIQQPHYINEYLNTKCFGNRTFDILYDKDSLVPGSEYEYALKFRGKGNTETYCLELFLGEPGTVEFAVSVSKCVDDKVQLYDGKTGQPYESKTNAVIPFIIKHKHQVSEKIAARSSGTFYNNYDQPPHGKDRDGGQKLGAMEMWSLAESGAVNLLEELMTYKSDDAHGRQRFAAYNNELRKKANNNPSAIAQYGNISELDLQSTLGVRETNAPFVTKKISALLAGSFINLKYFNAEGKEIYIYEDAYKGTSGNNANVELMGRRFKDEFVQGTREDVQNLHSNMVKNGKDIGAFAKLGGYKSSGDDYQNGRTIAPLEGWGAAYSVYGSTHYKTADGLKGEGEHGQTGDGEYVSVETANLGYIEDTSDGIEIDDERLFGIGDSANEQSIFNIDDRGGTLYDARDASGITDANQRLVDAQIVDDTEQGLEDMEVVVPHDLLSGKVADERSSQGELGMFDDDESDSNEIIDELDHEVPGEND